jgi:class 3 adenylate cyclase
MKRKIAAIMAADIAGYSRLVAEDEEETLRRLAAYRAVIDDFIAKAGGRIFNTAGDAVMAEFASAVEAVRCAIDVQESLRTRNLAYPPSRQMHFRIGITIGDVVERDGDLLGDGVNIAARLEGLAQVGGICISRAVHEQVANKLSVQFEDIGEQQVKNIPTPVHTYMLQLRGEDGVKAAAAPRKSSPSASRWKWPAVIALAGVGAIAVAAAYLPLASYLRPVSTTQREATTAPATPRTRAARPQQRQALVPETVPFISDRDRAQVRSVYMSAPDHKALAVSATAIGLNTGQPNEEIARQGALDMCQRATDSIIAARSNPGLPSRCEIFAVGNLVVSARASPPMPPQPWFTRNAAIETPFSAAQVPLVNEAARNSIDRFFGRAPKAKALALSPVGGFLVHNNQGSVQEAVRRALDRCGSNSGVACMIVAVDDVFVVPIPTAMKVVGFAPSAINAVTPEMRDEVARRLGNAPSGWNAVAVGAGGQPGVTLGAASEQAAITAALAECGRQDRGCRMVILGPFAVEGTPTFPAAPALAPSSPIPSANNPSTLAATLTAMRTLTPAARDELVNVFEGAKSHKALVGVPGTNRHWRVIGQPSAEAAQERALEGCQVWLNQPCAPVALNDRATAEPADGKWPIRDMPRIHYAGAFDPERIPSALPGMRERADIVGYRSAPGPKAAAFHPWGRIFIVTNAESQRAAEERSLGECNADPTRSGQNGPCFLYATGDQVILPQRRSVPVAAAP